MCRMLGGVFLREFPIPALEDLRRVAQVGLVPEQAHPGHTDGWGIVSFMDGSPRYLGRSPKPMHLDGSFDAAMAEVRRLSAPNVVIAHARAASKGGPRMENTHPFVVGSLVLAHNGTVHGLTPPSGSSPKGESDSETLALLLAERYSENGDLEAALRSLIAEEVRPREYTAAVLLVSDGRTLLGYRDFTSDDRSSYYDLRLSRCRDHVTLFQETVSGHDGEVSQVRNGEIVAVSLDLSVRRSALH